MAVPLGLALLWVTVALAPLTDIPSNWGRHKAEILLAIIGLVLAIPLGLFVEPPRWFLIGFLAYCPAVIALGWLGWRRQRARVDAWAQRVRTWEADNAL